MKGSEQFKETIKSYLDKRAETDELFAVSYANENKNIDDCIKYIFMTVQKSGINGFHDDEIYSMAVHYYDEDAIEIKDISIPQVVVNHQIELTDEEKAQAKQKAIDDLVQEQKNKMKGAGKKKKPVQAPQPVIEKTSQENSSNVPEKKEIAEKASKQEYVQESLF